MTHGDAMVPPAGGGRPEPPVKLKVHAVAHGGDGLGRVEGRVCFVPFALPGDTVRAKVFRRKASVSWARMLGVIEPSPHRIPFVGGEESAAPAHVWGCFSYPAQAEWKMRIVTDCLRRIGGVDAEPEWVEEPGLRLGYRTRAEFHGDGAVLGYYAVGTHTIVPMTRCPLCHDTVNTAFARLAPLGIRGGVVVTAHPVTGETMVWAPPEALDRVRALYPLANAPGDGAPRASFMVDGVPAVNGAFSQSSFLLNRLLVGLVREMAAGAESLLDLYCGNGNLSLSLIPAARVTGYDIAVESVEAARALGGDYRRGGEPEMAAALEAGGHDTVLLDPPRSGAFALAPALARCGAARMVYVSCDPATLARDLKIIIAGGWRLRRLAALDLFPYTPHVETVCLLER